MSAGSLVSAAAVCLSVLASRVKFRCPHTFGHTVYRSGLPSKCVETRVVIFQLQLREAHEVIADKDGVIEEKERMITLVSQEKEELAREIQVHLPKTQFRR